jgi:SAM-dependent methyltransferase
MFALARKSVEHESPGDEGIIRCQIFSGNELEGADGKLLALIGKGKRILSLGSVNEPLGRALEAQGCEIVPICPADDGLNGINAVSVVDLNRFEETDCARFDVVLAAGSLEQLHDPLAVLKAVKRFLRQDGCLVAVVPNVAHGNVRVALLSGQFPYSNVRAYQEAPLHFFTYESMVDLLEEAEFAIGALERHEEDVNVADGMAANTSPELLDSVLQAPESRTAQFLVAAYPLPGRGLGWLQKQMHHLAAKCAAAKQDVDEAREDFEAVNSHLRMLLEQQDAFLRREKELRAQLVSVHDLLMRRDAEIQQLHTMLNSFASVINLLRRSIIGRAYRFGRRVLKGLVKGSEGAGAGKVPSGGR